MSTHSNRRIVFIDALRAYAILMMLQGHFTDTMLAPAFRDTENPIFALWLFMRGMTAPIFFFTTGLVFTYLLLKNGKPFEENPRVRKGLRRGLSLILIGYVLRLNFPALLSFHIYPSFFIVDVLHCIGLSLLGLIALYVLHQHSRISFPILLGSAGAFLFLIYPDFRTADWSGLPMVLSNYFTRVDGSVFTPVPWMGFAFLGGVMGYYVNRRPQLDLTNWFPAALIATGLLIHYYSSHWLMSLYHMTGWENFRDTAYNNFLFWHLGHVFIVAAVVILVCRFSRNIPSLFLKTGQETLTIYSVHYVLLYGTWFGFGIVSLGHHSLGPWTTFLGALSFLLSFVILIAWIEEVRRFIYDSFPAFLIKTFFQLKGYSYNLYRIGRIRLIRYYRNIS